MPKIKKHPDSQAWDDWQKSEEGKMAIEPSILKSPDYVRFLLSRLEMAFLAGIRHSEKKIRR